VGAGTSSSSLSSSLPPFSSASAAGGTPLGSSAGGPRSNNRRGGSSAADVSLTLSLGADGGSYNVMGGPADGQVIDATRGLRSGRGGVGAPPAASLTQGTTNDTHSNIES
jgi:hypothetical protein